MIRVAINPDLLRWARERAGLAQEDLTKKFARLPRWETGEAQPTLKQVEAFARAVHVPPGYLFLSEPPEESIPIPDFRSVAGQSVTHPSPKSAGYDLCLPGAAELVSRVRTRRAAARTWLCRQRHDRGAS